MNVQALFHRIFPGKDLVEVSVYQGAGSRAKIAELDRRRFPRSPDPSPILRPTLDDLTGRCEFEEGG
jgi:hypothetical protein